MENAAGLIKLVPDHDDDLAEWQATLNSRQDEVRRTLREEGVLLEAWFRIDVDEQPYLLWFMRAQSIKAAREAFLKSTHDIDAFHLEKMTRMADAQIFATPLADLTPGP